MVNVWSTGMIGFVMLVYIVIERLFDHVGCGARARHTPSLDTNFLSNATGNKCYG